MSFNPDMNMGFHEGWGTTLDQLATLIQCP